MDKRFIIADLQEITRLGISSVVALVDFLTQRPTIVSCKKELVSQLCQNENAVVILDYTLFDFRSVAELLIVAERFPQTAWVLFSEGLSDDFLRRITLEVSFGVVHKLASVSELKEALMMSQLHQPYYCQRTRLQIDGWKHVAERTEINLTATEREVLKGIALGKTTKEIAVERSASFHTINSHRKNIFRKLDVNNVHEAIKYALRAGIVDSSEYYI